MALLKESKKERWMKEYTAKEILGPWTYVSVPVIDFADGPALYYDTDLYIEIHEDHYYLVIDNYDWISEDLCYLEELLAEHRIDCGYEPYKKIMDENNKDELILKLRDIFVDDLRDFLIRCSMDELKILDDNSDQELITKALGLFLNKR